MTEQKYEIVEYEGKSVRKYPDGSLRDEEGLFIRPSSSLAITSERAKELATIRWAKARQSAIDAIKQETGVENEWDGVKAILRKRVQVALTDSGRAGNDAAKMVLQAADVLRDHRIKEVIVNHGYEVSPRMIELLKEVARLKNDLDYESIEGMEVE